MWLRQRCNVDRGITVELPFLPYWRGYCFPDLAHKFLEAQAKAHVEIRLWGHPIKWGGSAGFWADWLQPCSRYEPETLLSWALLGWAPSLGLASATAPAKVRLLLRLLWVPDNSVYGGCRQGTSACVWGRCEDVKGGGKLCMLLGKR